MEPLEAPTFAQFDVTATRRASYRVLHEPGLLARYGAVLREEVGAARLAVLSDVRVHSLFGRALESSLLQAGYSPQWIVVPEGERSKDLRTFEHVLGELQRLGIDRRGVLVNFGGGVVSDLGGYVAASHLRGIRYANFATSLMAQVDASVGGKVAVNSPHGKNLIGAFHHPVHVAADAQLLGMLGDRDFRSGMAEVIKVAILASPELFLMLQRERHGLVRRDAVLLTRVAAEAVRVKMALIAQDPYEEDLRRPLNFGHTLGHPIETDFAYQAVRHGEAVAIGMGVATLLARRAGRCDRDTALAIFGLLGSYDLIGNVGPLSTTTIIDRLREVRLVRGGLLNFVLPEAIGAVHITSELPDSELAAGFEAYEALVGGWLAKKPLEQLL